MNYLKEISDFINNNSNFKNKIFEKDGVNYVEEYNELGEIQDYYSVLNSDSIEKIENNFDIKLNFNDNIICKCGNESFSVKRMMEKYELWVKCTKCENEFVAYDG